MTFALAVIIIAAAATVVIALIAYQLSVRVHELEQAVQGGLTAPSRRLTREEFEHRFDVARHRAVLAADIGTGLVIFVDATADSISLDRPEPAADTEPAGTSPTGLVATLNHLSRADAITVVSQEALVPGLDQAIAHRPLSELNTTAGQLGVATFPFVMIVDNKHLRHAQPFTNAQQLTAILKRHI